MNDYELKQARKKAYFAEKSKKIQAEAEQIFQRAKDMAGVIPFGQPILVGHHSEKRDRNYRKKISNTFDKAFELSKKAEYYEDRATTQTNAISSDDADALSKLEQKLESLIASHERMKEVSKLYKREGDACFEKITAAEREAILSVRRFFPAAKACQIFNLANSNQNIRQVKQRIAALKHAKSKPEPEPIHGKGFILKEDKDDNRILFIFEGKPSNEVRAILKQRAFKWSPNRGAWIRMLNNQGRVAADMVISELNELDC